MDPAGTRIQLRITQLLNRDVSIATSLRATAIKTASCGDDEDVSDYCLFDFHLPLACSHTSKTVNLLGKSLTVSQSFLED